MERIAIPRARTRPRTAVGRALHAARDTALWLCRTPAWLILILADIAIIISVSQVMFGKSYPNTLERQWDSARGEAYYEQLRAAANAGIRSDFVEPRPDRE